MDITSTTGQRISVQSLIALDSSKLKITKLPDDMAAHMEEVWKEQFRTLQGKADNDPSYLYATVKVDGKVVAKIYNGGITETSNATHIKISGLSSMGDNETLTGPALAEKRAKEIAQKLGGKVEKASTAMTQTQWDNREKPTWVYDTAAMETARKERDARIAEGQKRMEEWLVKSTQAQTNIDAQLLAQAEI